MEKRPRKIKGRRGYDTIVFSGREVKRRTIKRDHECCEEKRIWETCRSAALVQQLVAACDHVPVAPSNYLCHRCVNKWDCKCLSSIRSYFTVFLPLD